MIHLLGPQAISFRVLIVDGEAIQRLILTRCVEMLGWRVETAANTGEAAAKFAAHAHDVVVIDLGLDERDLLNLLRQLRHDHADPSVIFLSGPAGKGGFGAFHAAHELGLRVAGTLASPIDPYSLHALLLSNPVRERMGSQAAGGRLSMGELKRALLDGEIHTEYQPKTDLFTGEIVGMEALARWRSPSRGIIPPARFVPMAERSGLIGDLTFRVLEDAISACREWRQVRPNCSVSVNISPLVLADPGLPARIHAILNEHGLPPEALMVEVTESTMIANLPMAIEALTRLSIRGVRVSMDDFGTGYSSLLSLLRMPFTELKIDRSFVSVCRTDPEAWKIVRTTVSLARELGMRVVAEGIESEDISDRLRDVGCDIGQGWFFGHPMEAGAAMRWLAPTPAPVLAVPMPSTSAHRGRKPSVVARADH